MPKAGTKPKASFNTFSGSQLLHSSMHTLICCTNTAELPHSLGKGNTALCYSYNHFLQIFLLVTPAKQQHQKLVPPHLTQKLWHSCLAGTGGISCPRTMVTTAHPAASWSCLGQSFSTLGKTYSQKLCGLRGRGIITTQLQLLLQELQKKRIKATTPWLHQC